MRDTSVNLPTLRANHAVANYGTKEEHVNAAHKAEPEESLSLRPLTFLNETSSRGP
jgi:hypothetical protein